MDAHSKEDDDSSIFNQAITAGEMKLPPGFTIGELDRKPSANRLMRNQSVDV